MFAEDRRQREAALLLHGLAPSARHEVLARLAPAEQRLLEPLLAELSLLGIPQSFARSSSTTVAPVNLSVDQRIGSLSPAVVAAVLKHCSPITVAAVLDQQEMRWADAVCDLLPPAQQILVAKTRGTSASMATAARIALGARLLGEVFDGRQSPTLKRGFVGERLRSWWRWTS